MRSVLTAVIISIGYQGLLMAEEIPPSHLSEDSPVRSDRPAGWVHETLGNTNMLRYHPIASHELSQTTTADLIAAISNIQAHSPLPLGAISLGDYLRHSPSLQTYLSHRIGARHRNSLLKAMARPGMMPIQGVDDAPPLPSIASEILKDAPGLKEVRKALQDAGYGIRNITWDQFQVTERADQLLFHGNVILHLQPLPGK